jgi:hypothetical protein
MLLPGRVALLWNVATVAASARPTAFALHLMEPDYFPTATLKSFEARKAIFFFAGILMDSPVEGLRPVRAACLRTCRLLRRGIRMRFPSFKFLTSCVTRSSGDET